VVGGLAAGVGLSAAARHRAFVSAGCAPGGDGARPLDCDERARAGKTAQLEANVLLGATAVLAVTTVALAVFAVRWKDSAQARVTVGASRATVTAQLELVMP
jgi:hypothetical protein